MNVSANEIMIIIVIAVVVIGPQRLPEYAEQLGKLVRNLKSMATDATATLREELGDEGTDLDLSKFDPRQYDPRRIVREALMEDVKPKKPTKPRSSSTSSRSSTSKATKTAGSAVAATAGAVAAAASTGTATAVADAPVEDAPIEDEGTEIRDADELAGATAATGSAVDSDIPPFDDEAT